MSSSVTLPIYDFVIPLFQIRWNTRAVLEGITVHYQPRTIHIIAPIEQIRVLEAESPSWHTANLELHPEEEFFQPLGLSKEQICAELDLGKSLYTPGWFYQQLLKMGAFEAIANLSEWYVVWDSDLLPVDSWPLVISDTADPQYKFALLQHNAWGNSSIVSDWANWISTVLKVEPLTNEVGTFIPHHMWFRQKHLRSLTAQINRYYQSTDHWLLLMMRSANEFRTFSEYWLYISWVAVHNPEDLVFYNYEDYGSRTERFFDDGTGLFSVALRQQLSLFPEEELSPSYKEVLTFIQTEYGVDALPSSLSFESSPRHLKKDRENMHIEEVRSRWNPRQSKPDLAMTQT